MRKEILNMGYDINLNPWHSPRNILVYDTEVYPNVFLMGIKNTRTDKSVVYEISHRKNDLVKIKKLMKTMQSGWMVGYNNLGFDYPILHILYKLRNNLPVKIINQKLFEKCDQIIRDGRSDDPNAKFKHTVWDSDMVCPQIDLFKIWHFDNAARSTSLKELEFNMKAESIKDLPFKPGMLLDDDQIDQLVDYLMNGDIVNTEAFYNITTDRANNHKRDRLEIRKYYTKKFDHNFMNHNDTKIGKDYFGIRLEEEGQSCYDDQGNKKRTPRRKIKFKDIIFHDVIKFETPEFQAMLDFLDGFEITKTKEVFNDLPTDVLGDLRHYCTDIKKQMTRKGKVFPERVKGLNVVKDGMTYYIGTGGIHGSIHSATVTNEDDYEVIDIDVRSYYPSIIAKYGLYPAHLGPVFAELYADLIEERRKWKKGTPENGILKLALNGTYGDSNNQFSKWFYDPQLTMQITINGQLMLLMLSEWLTEQCNDLAIIQVNTDGVTFRVHKSESDKAMSICKEWEDHTMMPLEVAWYDTMWIKDVNNYIARYIKAGDLGGPYEPYDGIKQKGTFQFDFADIDEWAKNFSGQAIKKAAFNNLVHGKDIYEWMVTEADIYDFAYRAKMTGQTKLILGGDEIQKISRFYVTREGKPIKKLMPPLPKNLHKLEGHYEVDDNGEKVWHDFSGWRESAIAPIGENLITIKNSSVGIDESLIDYDFYVGQAEKITKPLKKKFVNPLEVVV